MEQGSCLYVCLTLLVGFFMVARELPALVALTELYCPFCWVIAYGNIC